MTDRAYRLTPEMVSGLWGHMAKTYDFQVMAKDDAPAMVAVANFLDLMKIMDKDTFLENYTTTIGRVVFPNFTPGVVEAGRRPLPAQVRTCGHETRHVVQFDEESVGFMLRYLADHSARARYELEALQVSQEVHFFLYGDIPDPDDQAAMLLDYRCSEDDVKFVVAGLRSSARTIRAGGIVREESAAVCNYLRQAGL